MLWIVIVVLTTIICGFLFVVGKNEKRVEDAYGDKKGSVGKTLQWASALAFVIMLSLSTGITSIHPVQAGQVGVVYQFGAIIGQRGEGLQGIAPWQDMTMWDIKIQRVRPETKCLGEKIPECLESFSSETQDVFIRATINLSVSPENVQKLARTVGSDYINKLVLPRLHQIAKDTTVRYKSVDIAPHREDIRASIRDRLKEELARYSIEVDDLLIDNMDFREPFKLAIEAKQNATQEALRQEALIAAKTAEAVQKAEEAKGNANKLRIEAEGQAAANRLVSESLTPALIQWQAVQKFAPDVKFVLLPSGQGIIIDPAALLGQAESTK